MEEKNNKNFISTVIKKREEIYYLVTERDMNMLRNSNIFGDISIIIALIMLSGYFIDKNNYALLAGIIFILTAVAFYYFVFSEIKKLKSSGEIKSLDVDSNKTQKISNSSKNKKEDKNKFIVNLALYFTDERTKDITKEIQNMVQNNKLTIIASNKIAGDPHPGTKKQLIIRYIYNNVSIVKSYNEGDKIELP